MRPEKREPAGASRLEQALARGVPAWIVLLLAILGCAMAIALAALMKKPERHGAAGRFAVAVADVPDTIGDWWKGPVPYYGGSSYARVPAGFTRNAAQPLVDRGYALITPYDPERGRATVQLMRLSDGGIVHEWRPDIDGINARSRLRSAIVDLKRDRNVARMRPMHPLLLADGSIIIHDNSPLARIDACSRTRWIIDGMFHHALEPAGDGTLWIPYRLARSTEANVGARFADEGLAQVTAEGRPLRTERLVDIFARNGMAGLWRGRPYVEDPFHINDIQPVPADGPYWRRGDLFLSLRNMSMVLLYRPATGRVIWWQAGPWAAQHDVGILDDHRISIFDNNVPAAYPRPRVAGTSRLLVYDFAARRTSSPFERAFTRHDIATLTQGRGTPLANGDLMVEETERGRLMRIAPDGEWRWRYISADADRRRLWLSWSRYLDGDAPELRGALHALAAARCARSA